MSRLQTALFLATAALAAATVVLLTAAVTAPLFEAGGWRAAPIFAVTSFCVGWTLFDIHALVWSRVMRRHSQRKEANQ